MDIIERLKKLGYTSQMINDRIKIVNNELYIEDFNLLIDILNNTDDDFIIRDHKDLILTYKIYNLFRLIRLGRFELAHRLAERIYEQDKEPEVKLIIDNLKYDKDDINFIVDEGLYDNPELLENFKELEKKVLLDYYFNDLEKAGQKLEKIYNLYCHQSPLNFKVYISYVNKIDELKRHHTLINKRRLDQIVGEPLGVLVELLNSEDFYRAHGILEEYYLSNVKHEFSVIWEVARIFDSRIMNLLKENEENVRKQIDLNSNGLNDEATIVGRYDLSTISEKTIDKLKKREDIDVSLNYYSLYYEYRSKKQFKEARDAINKYQYITDQKGLEFNFKHLLFEVDVIEENYKNTSEEELDIRDRFIDEGDELAEAFNYEEALEKYLLSLDHEYHHSPSTLSRIGECYTKLGKYNDAYLAYQTEEKDFLYQEDYENYIECMYRLGKYEEIPKYVSRFEEEYHIDSSFLHYILSLLYLNKKNYREAESEISTCEIIDQEVTGLPLQYCYERNMIYLLTNGKNIKPYTLDNYYDHCYNEEEINLFDDLDINNIEEGEFVDTIRDTEFGESLEKRLQYLIVLYKALIEMDRRDDAKELEEYIEEFIESPELSSDDKSNFTSVLKNYRKL